MRILEQVEFHRHAGRNAGSSARQAGTVTQTTARRTERGNARVLDGESHTVGTGVDELEGEVVGEALHIDWGGEPGAASLRLPTVGQLQTSAIQLGASIELQTSRGESRSEIDAGGTAALNGDDRGGGVAGCEVWSRGDGFYRGGGANGERTGVRRRRCSGLTAIQSVEDGGARSGVGNVHGLRRRISPGDRRDQRCGRWGWHVDPDYGCGGGALREVGGGGDSFHRFGGVNAKRSSVLRRRSGRLTPIQSIKNR